MKNFLALGDSYTIGECVEENSWPIQLQQALKKSQINIDVQIIAQTGWTTDELAQVIYKKNIQKNFDMVSLSIGVNNQYRGQSEKKYRKEFIWLLEQAINFAGKDPKKVIVVSIPDWGITPFAKKDKRSSKQIGQQIDIFNNINAKETKKRRCHYIDITPLSRKKDASLVANDGLHPSAKMYNMWVEKIYPVALKIIK
ncbi:SGNH/GDSL hydrolase family protein [Candidatus Uabimicrobium sp. HlEnr_7]|uniref:SGNH/GDSL hydrolase family protein n=1 Tax=Candidatus Uabimicrobium helgolandensis TaxID=3095367 RepID=UPI003556C1A6